MKAEYKTLTGADWQPASSSAKPATDKKNNTGADPKASGEKVNSSTANKKPSTEQNTKKSSAGNASSSMGDSTVSADELKKKIDAQGETVRQLKTSKAPKVC